MLPIQLSISITACQTNKKLVDGLLTLVNYEKKFILLKDATIYEQFS